MKRIISVFLAILLLAALSGGAWASYETVEAETPMLLDEEQGLKITMTGYEVKQGKTLEVTARFENTSDRDAAAYGLGVLGLDGKELTGGEELYEAHDGTSEAPTLKAGASAELTRTVRLDEGVAAAMNISDPASFLLDAYIYFRGLDEINADVEELLNEQQYDEELSERIDALYEGADFYSELTIPGKTVTSLSYGELAANGRELYKDSYCRVVDMGFDQQAKQSSLYAEFLDVPEGQRCSVNIEPTVNSFAITGKLDGCSTNFYYEAGGEKEQVKSILCGPALEYLGADSVEALSYRVEVNLYPVSGGTDSYSKTQTIRAALPYDPDEAKLSQCPDWPVIYENQRITVRLAGTVTTDHGSSTSLLLDVENKSSYASYYVDFRGDVDGNDLNQWDGQYGRAVSQTIEPGAHGYIMLSEQVMTQIEGPGGYFNISKTWSGAAKSLNGYFSMDEKGYMLYYSLSPMLSIDISQ